jgi:hypothetical protein
MRNMVNSSRVVDILRTELRKVAICCESRSMCAQRLAKDVVVNLAVSRLLVVENVRVSLINKSSTTVDTTIGGFENEMKLFTTITDLTANVFGCPCDRAF